MALSLASFTYTLVRMTTARPKKIKKLKSSATARFFSLSKMTVKAGAQVAKYGLQKAFTNPDSRLAQWRELLISQSEMLTNELSELKGSLMKAGQQLSVYGEHFFPPEVNAILKQLQAQSAPLEWEPIEKTMKQNLAEHLIAKLEINHEALSAASLGQVHRAQIKDTHEEIVLKIQYPGVARAIGSDLRALRTFLSMAKLLPSGKQIDQLFDEIKTMLVQETDFEQEATRTNEFAAKLHGDTRFVIPRVYGEFSNKFIFAASYEPSHRLDSPEVQNLSPERRNKISYNFLDLYFKELFLWKVVQTDPHLGNYGIRIDETGADDRIVLYDFGAVRTYPEDFMREYYALIAASLNKDKDGILSTALRLKFIYDDDDQELKDLFFEFCCDMVEPFFGLYDWKNSTLPQRLTKKLLIIKNKFSVRAPPREILFLDRKMGGVFIALSVLKATLDSHDLITTYLSNSHIISR
jgi:predicted unusual protein kinase regulating ubiquinone biosynthesis (AarF/ABC1/UbiB family)